MLFLQYSARRLLHHRQKCIDQLRAVVSRSCCRSLLLLDRGAAEERHESAEVETASRLLLLLSVCVLCSSGKTAHDVRRDGAEYVHDVSRVNAGFSGKFINYLILIITEDVANDLRAVFCISIFNL